MYGQVNVASIIHSGYHKSYAYPIRYADVRRKTVTSTRELAPSLAPVMQTTSQPRRASLAWVRSWPLKDRAEILLTRSQRSSSTSVVEFSSRHFQNRIL